MKRGIIITTSPYTKDFLEECLLSLPREYPVLVVINNFSGDHPNLHKEKFRDIFFVPNDWNGFELGGILRGSEHFDEFVHLMDTCVLKDPSIIKTLFMVPGSVCFSNGFFSYLGKYRTCVLTQVGIPKITTKEEAVRAEWEWNAKYLAGDPQALKFDPVLPIESDRFERRHGRTNMVLENDFIIKYKGTWK